jgi:hypothetical protein
VSFRSSQVAESYEVGTHPFRRSADYRLLTSGYDGTTTGEGREMKMLKPRQLVAFTPTCRDEIRRRYTFIPRNRFCVRAG